MFEAVWDYKNFRNYCPKPLTVKHLGLSLNQPQGVGCIRAREYLCMSTCVCAYTMRACISLFVCVHPCMFMSLTQSVCVSLTWEGALDEVLEELQVAILHLLVHSYFSQ